MSQKAFWDHTLLTSYTHEDLFKSGVSQMNDSNPMHLRDYYEFHWLSDLPLSSNEDRRIQETLKLIPGNWKSIIDVGCGDGRVSRSLLSKGLNVIGMDWSESSLRKFEGRKVVADIRKSWPFRANIDGVICS